MKNLNRNFVWPVLSMFVLTSVLYGFSASNFLENAELYIYQNIAPSRPFDQRIAIIENDTATSTDETKRKSLTKLIEIMQEKPPLILGIIAPLSSGKSEHSPTDKALSKTIFGSRYPLVLAVETDGDVELLKQKFMVAREIRKPLRIFSNSQNVSLAHAEFTDEATGVGIRRFPMSLTRKPAFVNDTIGQSEFYDAFGRVLVASAKVSEKYTTRTSPNEEIIFANNPDVVPKVLLSKIINGDRDALESLSGKIVMLDLSTMSHARDVRAFFRTRQASDLEIHAQIANMFIQGYRRATLPPLQLFLRLLVASLIPLLVYYASRKLWLVETVSFILLIVYIFFARYAFANDLAFPLAQMSLSLLLGLLICIFCAKVVNEREKTMGLEQDEKLSDNESAETPRF